MTTSTKVKTEPRMELSDHQQGLWKAMLRFDAEVGRCGLERSLLELVRTRASQINNCAYCIDMHTKDARALGETEQRIYSLPAWRETPFFTERERAALAFAESVTLLAEDHVPSEAYEAVAAHFEPDEIAALVGLLVTINAWNGIAVSTRAWPPGSYQP